MHREPKLIQLPPQLFVGPGVESEKMTPATNTASGWIKPEGGLWTSTYDPECGSGWVQWSMGERFRVECDDDYETCYFDCSILYPKPARILIIDTHQDLVDAIQDYHFVGSEPRSYYAEDYLDFEEIAEDYDAVHLTDRGQWKTRRTRPGLYGWDLESTVWLRWMFSEVEHIGRVGFSSCDMSATEEKKLKMLGLFR
jgi:hypothetical protein